MSWKVHGTDEVFAALRGLCSNSYRMYDPSEHRYYYDHECDAYECVVEDAAEEYERLLKHCNHQREQLKSWGNVPTLRKIMEGGMDNIDGGTETERIEGSSITEELREAMEPCISSGWLTIQKSEFKTLADRIDAEHKKAVELARMDGMDATFGNGWVKLPVDADGVPIHVGDVMEFSRFDVSYNPAVKVDGIGAGVFFSFDEKLGRFAQKDANAYRHVQPDSWERIIQDAIAEGYERMDVFTPCEVGNDELVERCRRVAGS